MSLSGLCVVFIPGWVAAGKWQSQQEVVCPCGAVRSPTVSGRGRVYINPCVGALSLLLSPGPPRP